LTLERPHRQRGAGGAAAWRHAAGVAQHLLQFLLRGLQFAGELGVQIAPPIDVAHQVVPRRGRLRRRRLRALGLGAERRQLLLALLQRRPCGRELVERSLKRHDALPIDGGQRRDRARRLAETLHVGCRQQEANVARATELVDLNQPRAKLRPRDGRRLVECGDPLARRVQFVRARP
jgi:hypothetical protein